MRHFGTRDGRICFAILEVASVLEKDSARAGLFLWIYKWIRASHEGFVLSIPGAKWDLLDDVADCLDLQ